MTDVTRTCRDINALNPKAQIACNLFMEECKKQGLNVLITETYRSRERQNYLYEQGRTREGKIVTWTRTSRHTSKMAWDICKNVKGQEYNDSAFFKKCGEIAKKLGITWGGTWKTPDTPHFEINNTWTEPKPEYEITKTKIRLFGVEKEIERILKDGQNYIKLQSINCSELIVNYINGTIMINGKTFTPNKKILINGNNYVLIRELEDLGFKIGYVNKIITIN